MSFIVFALSACNADVVKIEDYEWEMRTVMSNDTESAQYQDELVVAVGEADELYPDAEIVDMTLTAKDGEITITDTTNGKTYNGTKEDFEWAVQEATKKKKQDFSKVEFLLF